MSSHFAKHSGKYRCRYCGKLTRETGMDESSYNLCRACLIADQERHDADNHRTTTPTT